MSDFNEGYKQGIVDGYRGGCRMTKKELMPEILKLRKKLHEAEDKLQLLSIDIIFDNYPIPTPYDIKDNKGKSLEGEWLKRDGFYTILRIKL